MAAQNLRLHCARARRARKRQRTPGFSGNIASRGLARGLLFVPGMSKPIPSISKYMTTTPHTVSGSVTLAAAGRLMQEHGIRHLPVVDDGELLGMITDRDIKYVSSFGFVQPENVPIRGAMTEKPYTVAPETPLDEVAATMAEHKYGSAIVVQNGHVVGVFTTVDACSALSELLGSRLRK